MSKKRYLVVPRLECKFSPTLPEDERWPFSILDKKCSNLDIIQVTDGLRPIVRIDFLGLESFHFIRAELVVQDSIHVDDDVVLLGSFGQFEKFFLGSILCTNPGLLVELAEVIEVVNVIADALQPKERKKNRFLVTS